MKRIAVIGAGMSGLTCAWELQKAGYAVTVFEANDHPGGRTSTRERDGLLFDLGADFYIGHYTQTKHLVDELGLVHLWKAHAPGEHALFRNGSLHPLALDTPLAVLRYTALSLGSRLRLLAMVIIAARRMKGLSFFDLSDNEEKRDEENAYDYFLRTGNKEIADILINGYIATYQFYSARSISRTAALAFMAMAFGEPAGMSQYHMVGLMQAIPNELVRRLDVRLRCCVDAIINNDNGVIVKSDTEEDRYDAAVVATTPNRARMIINDPTSQQRSVLSSVGYAKTISLSFRVPYERIAFLGIVSVPETVSSIVCSYSNEGRKEGAHMGDTTLINVWLHDAYARTVMDTSNEELFGIIGKELQRVCPPLQNASIIPHDLERWDYAMPTYEPRTVKMIKEFWVHGQGDNNTWLCGDYLNMPWVEGAVRCGQKVARAIIQSQEH